jgi:hypothetical protein
MIGIPRVFIQIEEIFHEFGPAPAKPLQRGAGAVVIRNPFAGEYVRELQPFMEDLKPVGRELALRLLGSLHARPGEITGYGKAAIVGARGELEHGALWHMPGGYALREALGWRGEGLVGGARDRNALAIVPSTKKVGPPGVSIDIPLTHVNASYVRSHLDSMELQVPGAPSADQLVFILAMSTGPRIHERMGGLRVDQIERWDGQR